MNTVSIRFPLLQALSLVFVMMASSILTPTTQGELVQNGNFETVGPNGSTTFHSGTGGVGVSAAEKWWVFHNSNGSTETNWITYADADLPTIFGSQDPFTDHVLRVEASHDFNGIVQVFSPLNTGPAHAVGSVWVWVNAGQQVGVGIGNGGGTQTNTLTSTTGTWEQLIFNETTSPVNEIAIYARNGSAEFYVDFASVQAIPEPSSFLGLGVATSCLGLIRRRRI